MAPDSLLATQLQGERHTYSYADPRVFRSSVGAAYSSLWIDQPGDVPLLRSSGNISDAPFYRYIVPTGLVEL